MGVMDFYGMLTVKHSSLFPESLPDEQNYFSLIMSGVCVGFLLLVIPIWIVQVKNWIREKPLPRSDSLPIARDSSRSSGEASDTGSMMLRPSSDWNPASFTNQASFLVPKHLQKKEPSYCLNHSKGTDSTSLGKNR